MELIPQLFLICLVIVNIFKDSEESILDGVLSGKSTKLRRGRYHIHSILRPQNVPDQNEYTDYYDEYDYEDLNGNNYNDQYPQAHSDKKYNVPKNPNGGRYNENIQNRHSIKNATLNNNNKNSIKTRPIDSTGLQNPGNVGKPTTIKITNGGIISDRFGEDSTSTVGESDKKNDTPEIKFLKRMTKTKFFFQVQPVIPEVDRLSAKDIVHYID